MVAVPLSIKPWIDRGLELLGEDAATRLFESSSISMSDTACYACIKALDALVDHLRTIEWPSPTPDQVAIVQRLEDQREELWRQYCE